MALAAEDMKINVFINLRGLLGNGNRNSRIRIPVKNQDRTFICPYLFERIKGHDVDQILLIELVALEFLRKKEVWNRTDIRDAKPLKPLLHPVTYEARKIEGRDHQAKSLKVGRVPRGIKTCHKTALAAAHKDYIISIDIFPGRNVIIYSLKVKKFGKD